MIPRFTLFFFLLPACASPKDTASSDAPPADYREAGPHRVAVTAYGATSARPPYLLWRPTENAANTITLADLETETDRANTMAALLADAPSECPTQALSLSTDPTPPEAPLPLVVVSHCHGCTWSSLATVARHLASWGFAVATMSHEGNTLYNTLSGDGLPLDTSTLDLRVAHTNAILDAARTGDLGVSVDPDRIALVGHSFGAVTVGMVLQNDPDVRAAVFLGAPAENPLLPGVSVAALQQPTAWVLLEEDNSIGALGNTLIETNFADASGPRRLVRMPDAGHWTVSDIVGLTDDLMPGCGTDTRQDGSGATFTYTDPEAGRATTAAVVTTALGSLLLDRADNVDALDALHDWNAIQVEAPATTP